MSVLSDIGDWFVDMTQASQPFLTSMAGVGAFGGASFDNQQQYLKLVAEGKAPPPPGGGYTNMTPPGGNYYGPGATGGYSETYTPGSQYTTASGGGSGYGYQGGSTKILGMEPGVAIGVGLAVAVGVFLMMR